MTLKLDSLKKSSVRSLQNVKDAGELSLMDMQKVMGGGCYGNECCAGTLQQN